MADASGNFLSILSTVKTDFTSPVAGDILRLMGSSDSTPPRPAVVHWTVVTPHDSSYRGDLPLSFFRMSTDNPEELGCGVRN